MSKRGGYSGGSTVFRLGSNWFSRPQPNVDPISGETRTERIQRLVKEAEKRKADREQGRTKKLGKRQREVLNLEARLDELKRFKKNEERRLKRVEKNLARLAEKESADPTSPKKGVEQQAARMDKVTVIRKSPRKVLKYDRKPSSD